MPVVEVVAEMTDQGKWGRGRGLDASALMGRLQRKEEERGAGWGTGGAGMAGVGVGGGRLGGR